MIIPDAIVCCFEYVPPRRGSTSQPSMLWKLVESFVIDEDRTILCGPGKGDDFNYEDFMYMDNEEDNPEEIMGRAITCWRFDQGIRLLALHPPQWIDLLSPSFTEELKKLPNWYVFLNCGYRMFMDTEDAARKALSEL